MKSEERRVKNSTAEEIQHSTLNTQHLKCTKSLVDKFDKFIADIPLEILDASVTQKVTDITIIYPVLFYTDTATGKRLFLDNNGLKVEAKLGAILRGAINPDPSSTYPFQGKGKMRYLTQ